MGMQNMSAFNSNEESSTNFIEAMAYAATAVSIVTTDGPAGRFGITVSAVCSVSAEPPMVLACINKKSPSVKAIEENGSFCVNLLNSDQSSISNCFAGRPIEGEAFSFEIADWKTAVTGSPILEDASANFDCILDNSFEAGTHKIFIGLVKSAVHSGTKPLAYSQREYKTLSPLEKQN